MPPLEHPDLLVGTATGDDAAVFKINTGKNNAGALGILSIDAFTPIVDDAHLFGAIAAANAASDIYAMGGTPKFALNIVVWPQETLGTELLSQVIAGGNETAKRGGWLVVGGHTISGSEPIYGQAVYGELADEGALLTNVGGKPGQSLVLTKPLGTGIITTALKAGAFENTKTAKKGDEDGNRIDSETFGKMFEEASQLMLTLNDKSAIAAREAKATSATDITGFGLLGHLHKLALASGVSAVIETKNVPTISGVKDLLEYAPNYSPGGCQKNLDFVKDFIKTESNIKDDVKNNTSDNTNDETPKNDIYNGDIYNSDIYKVLADPQTSGGLLFSCSEKDAKQAVEKLPHSAIIGYLTDDGTAGEISLKTTHS